MKFEYKLYKLCGLLSILVAYYRLITQVIPREQKIPVSGPGNDRESDNFCPTLVSIHSYYFHLCTMWLRVNYIRRM